ncbi:MAG: hypothetical protein ABSG76_27515, partial [Xanthobacteraceae bacterium]
PDGRTFDPWGGDHRRHSALGPHCDLAFPAMDHILPDAGRLFGTDQADAHQVPAGRAGLSQQLDGFGWRAMQAHRAALLQSLRHSAG